MERQSRLVHPHSCLPPVAHLTMAIAISSCRSFASWCQLLKSQYQSIDDTIVQLFATGDSVVMTHVDRVKSERLNAGSRSKRRFHRFTRVLLQFRQAHRPGVPFARRTWSCDLPRRSACEGKARDRFYEWRGGRDATHSCRAFSGRG